MDALVELLGNAENNASLFNAKFHNIQTCLAAYFTKEFLQRVQNAAPKINRRKFNVIKIPKFQLYIEVMISNHTSIKYTVNRRTSAIVPLFIDLKAAERVVNAGFVFI